jgi:hypothetical protein
MAEESLSPAQIKQMIGMLKAMLPEDKEAVTEVKTDTSPLINPNTPIKDAGPSYRSGKHYNKFDDMMENRLHKDDTELQKKLSQYPPVPRNRSVSMVEATCRVCGKTEEVSTSLLYEGKDRYKCNSCSKGSG